MERFLRRIVRFEGVGEDEGVIEGYGSVYGVVDDQVDAIMPGALKRSLRELKKSKQKLKMLWRHSEPIGTWDRFEEDEKGLFVSGRALIDDVQQAREGFALAKAGAIDGLSVGIVVRKEAKGTNGTRLIQEADLEEVSLAVWPANRLARITATKETVGTIRELERVLRDAGFSQGDAKAIAVKGFAGLGRREGDGSEEDANERRDAALAQEVAELVARNVSALRGRR